MCFLKNYILHKTLNLTLLLCILQIKIDFKIATKYQNNNIKINLYLKGFANRTRILFVYKTRRTKDLRNVGSPPSSTDLSS